MGIAKDKEDPIYSPDLYCWELKQSLGINDKQSTYI